MDGYEDYTADQQLADLLASMQHDFGAKAIKQSNVATSIVVSFPRPFSPGWRLSIGDYNPTWSTVASYNYLHARVTS